MKNDFGGPAHFLCHTCLIHLQSFRSTISETGDCFQEMANLSRDSIFRPLRLVMSFQFLFLFIIERTNRVALFRFSLKFECISRTLWFINLCVCVCASCMNDFYLVNAFFFDSDFIGLLFSPIIHFPLDKCVLSSASVVLMNPHIFSQ